MYSKRDAKVGVDLSVALSFWTGCGTLLIPSFSQCLPLLRLLIIYSSVISRCSEIGFEIPMLAIRIVVFVMDGMPKFVDTTLCRDVGTRSDFDSERDIQACESHIPHQPSVMHHQYLREEARARHIGWGSEPAYHPINIENRYPNTRYTVRLWQKFVPSDDDETEEDWLKNYLFWKVTIDYG